MSSPCAFIHAASRSRAPLPPPTPVFAQAAFSRVPTTPFEMPSFAAISRRRAPCAASRAASVSFSVRVAAAPASHARVQPGCPAGARAGLRVRRCQVRADRAPGNDEPRDLLVGQSLHDELGDLPLPRTQGVHAPFLSRPACAASGAGAAGLSALAQACTCPR